MHREGQGKRAARGNEGGEADLHTHWPASERAEMVVSHQMLLGTSIS